MKKREFIKRLEEHRHSHYCALEALAEVLFRVTAEHAMTLPAARGGALLVQVSAALAPEREGFEGMVALLSDLSDLIPSGTWEQLSHSELLKDVEKSEEAYHALVVQDLAEDLGYTPNQGHVVPPEITAVFKLLGESRGMTKEEVEERLTRVAEKFGVAFEGV